MIKNYIKIILRTIMQNKLGYFLNTIGLAGGLTAFLFIFYYVNYELDYDSFHTNRNEIYRVTLTKYQNGDIKTHSAENYPAVGEALEEAFPDVKAYTRLYNLGSKNNIILSRDGGVDREGYKVDRLLFTDSSFLKIFSFPMIEGDPSTCLTRANTAIISESFARKLFKNSNPVGQSIKMEDDDFKVVISEVTGVFKDVPANSHLKFDVLYSYATLPSQIPNGLERFYHSWERKDMYTYVQLKEGTDYKALEAKLPSVINRYKPDLEIFNVKEELGLQPLASIHLDSNLADEAERNGQRSVVYALALAGILVLLLAMINFLNYIVARSMTRAKDFGIRKVVGARQKDLYLQFLFEAFFLVVLAITVAIGIIAFSFPYFKNLAEIPNATLQDFFLSKSFLLAVGTGILAGLFFGGVLSATILNRFDLTEVVKGKVLGFGEGLKLRKGIITFQIAASIALIFVCKVVLDQTTYMTNFDLGINIDNTLVIDRPGVGPKNPTERKGNFDLFKNELLKNPNILSVTGSSAVPGKRIRLRTTVAASGRNANEKQTVDLAAIDEAFLQAMNLRILDGRNFAKEREQDREEAIIITDKMAKNLGFQNPDEAIGKELFLDQFDWKPKVIGVVDDYHHLSLREDSYPTAFFYNSFMSEYYLIKINPDQSAQALDKTKEIWTSTFPGNPFKYYYLTDYFDKQYSYEHILARYMLFFAILSILISGIGLFNISLFTMVQRTREIGIRKTLGASAKQIAWLLVKDYLKLIALAAGLALPLAYFFSSEWLSGFLYRISINGWIFAFSILTVLVISIVTISFHTAKATRIDPVNAIKSHN